MTIWAIFICFASQGCALQPTMVFQSRAECRSALVSEWRHMANGRGVWLQCKSRHVEMWQ